MPMTGKKLREHRLLLKLSQAKLAELSGVSQHVLSAYELGKIDLSSDASKAIDIALQNKEAVATLVKREKRYKAHEYIIPPRLPERVSKAKITEGNSRYREVIDGLLIKHNDKSEGRFSAISLFSGCGGFSLGFSAAGFDVKGYVELDEDLRKIYKENFPKSREIGGDITSVDDSKLCRYVEEIGSVDVIIGGPPCQGFSLSGKREVTDPRNQLFRHYLRFVDAFRPKFAVLENVRLLTSMKNTEGGFVMDDIANAFKDHGYKIKLFEVNAKNYGVPQHRDRILYIAVRNDIETAPSLPEPTHTEGNDFLLQAEPCRTFADACSDLAYLESGEGADDPLHEAVKHPAHVIDWLWDVQEGFSAHDNEDEGKRPPSGYNTTYKRQVWLEPASTVQTTFGMISGCRNVHPIATRSLTIREAARIQSFPDGYVFRGSLGTIRTGIGNAVPPLLAYYVAMHILDKLKFCKNSQPPN
ncbi:DNA (cytosine-5-)-methyltransferase [Chromobacterium haemolyticum]|uniref:Cytosine-specific methyltransferase n=2 Tax=Chromobacterium fluminis TaxID=3044269 RepID=A0ABX0KXD9_9NEIS|nr:DNA (cytosine-5-)-methyltransferase [Chromobacterium haemolyticum]